MTPFTLNDREYQIELALIRRGFGPIELSLSNVMRVAIINDSYEPFPRLIMTVKDPNGGVISYFSPDNNCKIIFTVMINERFGNNEHLIKKSHMFNIDNIKPLNLSGETNTYEIHAVSELITNWMNPVEFSTKNDNVSTTESAGNLLAKAGIPFIRPLKESTYKQFYITDINTPVRNHVSKLLDNASFNGDGFYYTWYDWVANKLIIESTKNIVMNSKLQPYNTITIPSGEYGASDMYSAKSVHFTNDVSATKINSISRGIREYRFDFINGKFIERKMEYIDIKNGSTITQLTPVIDNTINIESNINYTQQAASHDWFGEIRRAVRTYSGVSLKITGTLLRNIGDVVVLNSSEAEQKTFSGLWITMRIIDEFNFGTGKYDQDIIVSRVGKA